MPKIAVPPKIGKSQKTSRTARGTLLNIACLKISTAKNRKSSRVFKIILIELNFQ
jgi:hypothetical protein